MKHIKISALILLVTLLSASFISCSSEKSIVGKWIDDETEAMFEYTSDGYYYEYANENHTYDKTRYKLEDGKIIYYLEGDNPDDYIGIDYEITKEGHLIINGEIEYRPLTVPGKDNDK